jgi:predicted CoA-binding protein
MLKLNREFFENNEVLFVGYSGRNKAFSSMVYKAFTDNGIKVYPLNNKEGGSYDVKVYTRLSEIPTIPKSAYVLLNKENARKTIKTLADSGVKRILFQGKKVVDEGILEDCKSNGIEAVAACPMMIFGSGLHKIHGFFAGVRK